MEGSNFLNIVWLISRRPEGVRSRELHHENRRVGLLACQKGAVPCTKRILCLSPCISVCISYGDPWKIIITFEC